MFAPLGSRCGLRGLTPTGAAFRRLSPPFRSNPFPNTNTVLRVTEVEPLDTHRLRVSFNDGVVREVDCSFLLRGALGEPLRDPEFFKQVRVDEEGGTVVWPNGLDPAPELLHGDYEPPSAEPSQTRRARI